MTKKNGGKNIAPHILVFCVIEITAWDISEYLCSAVITTHKLHLESDWKTPKEGIDVEIGRSPAVIYISCGNGRLYSKSHHAANRMTSVGGCPIGVDTTSACRGDFDDCYRNTNGTLRSNSCHEIFCSLVRL